MKPKNMICLWFDKDAVEAARFYAATFPDSSVGTVGKAPGDFPGGKEGDEAAVAFPRDAFGHTARLVTARHFQLACASTTGRISIAP